MRNNVTSTGVPYCIFLVGELENNTSSNFYVIGDVFFQNFLAQFAFLMPDMKMLQPAPMVLFELQQKALPKAAIIDKTYRSVKVYDYFVRTLFILIVVINISAWGTGLTR